MGVADDVTGLDVADALVELRAAGVEVDEYPAMAFGPLLLEVGEAAADGPAVAVGMEDSGVAGGRGGGGFGEVERRTAGWSYRVRRYRRRVTRAPRRRRRWGEQ